MIIMCDKCKKPARFDQLVDDLRQELVITARCHGEADEMRIPRSDFEDNPDLNRQMDAGFGVAFRQAALLDA